MRRMASDYEIITKGGHDFLLLKDGTLIPTISGGRVDPPAGDPPEGKDTYTKDEVAKMLADNKKLITQLQQGLETQQGAFDELVEAIAQAVGEEGEEGEEEEGEPEEEEDEVPASKGRAEQASSE